MWGYLQSLYLTAYKILDYKTVALYFLVIMAYTISSVFRGRGRTFEGGRKNVGGNNNESGGKMRVGLIQYQQEFRNFKCEKQCKIVVSDNIYA